MVDVEFIFNKNGNAVFGIGYGMAVDFFTSTFLWTAIQIVLFQWPDLRAYQLNRKDYLDFRNRMVSFIHGVLCLALSIYHYLFMKTECGEGTIGIEYFILIMSGGYFTYDFLCMAWLKLLDLDMAFHHIICVAGIISMLLSQMGCGFLVTGLLVAEVSNPAMHVRMLLRHLNLRYTLVYEVAEYFYFASFFLGRIILGHPTVYHTVTCDKVSFLAKIVAFGLLLQSYLFLYRMYFIVRARLNETAEKKQKKITTYWLTPLDKEVLEKCEFYKRSKKVQEKLP